MEREKFSSRLGFILISAGCAIGLGNVWRFPYIVGQYGGAAFVLIYVAFLLLLGLPIIVMEFAVGRASQKSVALSFDVLEPKGSKWHIEKWFAMAGNYILMMFYTTVAGWLVYYFVKMAKGDFAGLDPAGVSEQFNAVMASPSINVGYMIFVVVVCFAICAMGLQAGVEKITKIMMVVLLLLMIVLAANSVMMKNSGPGLEFYLKPDFQKIKDAGLGEVVFAALGQSFFTLSIGIGALAIFTFINSWNDYFMQLIMLSSTSNLTISLGIAKLQAENSTDFGLIMAGAALAAIPIVVVFIAFQKYFTQGIAMGAVKG